MEFLSIRLDSLEPARHSDSDRQKHKIVNGLFRLCINRTLEVSDASSSSQSRLWEAVQEESRVLGEQQSLELRSTRL